MATLTSLKRVRNALINVTRKLVGDELSSVTQNGEQVPSVLKDISGGNIPSYPFITIASDSSIPVQGHKILDQYVDANNKLQIITEQYITFTFKSYGEGAESILNDLRVKINFGYDRWIMEQEAQATFMEFSDIQYQPIFLSERHIASSEMVARLTIKTIYSPEDDMDMVGVEVGGAIVADNQGNDINIDVEINTNE